MLAYFINRKQKTKIGSSFSDFVNILFGAPQDSIFGPFLFITYGGLLLLIFIQYACHIFQYKFMSLFYTSNNIASHTWILPQIFEFAISIKPRGKDRKNSY